MRYELLKELLPLIETFESISVGKASGEDFANWLLQNSKDALFKEKIEKKSEYYDETARLLVENSRLLVGMYRYAKSYARRAIPEDSPISFDDYSYLVVLYYEGKQTKMQLIERNIHEKSTGMEIIKRLIKLNLVEQVDNEADKRSKYIFLTAFGVEKMEAIQANMWELTKFVNGNLTADESKTLHSILTKLEHFHQPVFKANSK